MSAGLGRPFGAGLAALQQRQDETLSLRAVLSTESDVLRKILHRAQVVEGDAETRNKTFQVIVFGVLAEVKRENTEGADFPQAPKV